MRILTSLAAFVLAISPAGAAGVDPVRVFFDWGEPELTSDAKSTLDAFAAANPGRRLQLTGNTDRSGFAVHNRAVGYQRAATVRDYLQTKGFARSAMRLSTNGEDSPLVPTEDGVREVQNRRVEITLE